MASLPTLATELLDCWFADAMQSHATARQRLDLWFGHFPDFDRELTTRFERLPDRALAGEFEAWRAHPRGALALLIALDQLPRNLFRGTARAYACDAAAQAVAVQAIAAGHADVVHPVEVPFFYLPFEHAEDLALQQRCVAGYEDHLARAPDEFAFVLRDFVGAGREHLEIVERFGRFPHRNSILGRESTPAELAYLHNGGKHFGQQVVAKA